MLHHAYDEDLACIIQAAAVAEESIENVRVQVSQFDDLDLDLIFRLICTRTDKRITVSDLQRFLREENVEIDAEDSENLMKYLTSKQGVHLNYDDFISEVGPKTNAVHRGKILLQRGCSQAFQSTDVAEKRNRIFLLKILKAAYNALREIERIKSFVYKKHTISSSQAYKAINWRGYNSLDQESMERFMRKTRLAFSVHEWNLLLARYDKDKDGKLSSQEFHVLISPINSVPSPEESREFYSLRQYAPSFYDELKQKDFDYHSILKRNNQNYQSLDIIKRPPPAPLMAKEPKERYEDHTLFLTPEKTRRPDYSENPSIVHSASNNKVEHFIITEAAKPDVCFGPYFHYRKATENKNRYWLYTPEAKRPTDL